jgi:hypothetical protein
MRISVAIAGEQKHRKGHQSGSAPPSTASVACCAHQVQNFDLSQTFWCRGLWGVGFNEQIFGAENKT